MASTHCRSSRLNPRRPQLLAVRACLTSMQGEIQRSPPELAIDLTVFDPAQGVPDFVAGSGVEPFYQRKA